MAVELGWSKDPNAGMGWKGGAVSGIIAPDRRSRMRLVSADGLGGLEPGKPPSTDTIPNNHSSYAVQWFLFAVLAALIYGLALRKRWRQDEATP
jgi:surfeit locus 1 family protein